MSEVYCGPAPTPATLMWSWNPDVPALLLCAGIILAWGLWSQRRSLQLSVSIALLIVLFVSPLCALTTALFSARALHHVLLVSVAAPLLALAFPGRKGFAFIGIGWVVSLHAVIFWLWHAPGVYASAIVSPAGYWAMQISLLVSAAWLWARVFGRTEPAGAAILALLGTTVQMGMLGALLTFSSAPLYEPHFLTTSPFGLSPLQDQQLAGILMWVPAALPYLAAALFRALPLLGPSPGPLPGKVP